MAAASIRREVDEPIEALTKEQAALLEERCRARSSSPSARAGRSRAACRARGTRSIRTRSTADRGRARRLWDLDGNEYVDLHNGYGVMVVGHAHPKVVEAVRAAGRARHALRDAGRGHGGRRRALAASASACRCGGSRTRARRPRWTPCRIMRAATGRDLVIKVEGCYHGSADGLAFSLLDRPGRGRARATGADRRSRTRPAIPGVRRGAADRAVQRPGGRRARPRGRGRPRRRDDPRAGHDEHRRDPARRRATWRVCAETPAPARRAAHVRRGEDRA